MLIAPDLLCHCCFFFNKTEKLLALPPFLPIRPSRPHLLQDRLHPNPGPSKTQPVKNRCQLIGILGKCKFSGKEILPTPPQQFFGSVWCFLEWLFALKISRLLDVLGVSRVFGVLGWFVPMCCSILLGVGSPNGGLTMGFIPFESFEAKNLYV